MDSNRYSIIRFEGFWDCSDTAYLRNYLFLFGDNDLKMGKRGQAVIRDEPNAFGIPTKKRPFLSNNSFYTDAEYDENIKKINTAFKTICTKLDSGEYLGIVISSQGIGTGLAKLQIKAPRISIKN